MLHAYANLHQNSTSVGSRWGHRQWSQPIERFHGSTRMHKNLWYSLCSPVVTVRIFLFKYMTQWLSRCNYEFELVTRMFKEWILILDCRHLKNLISTREHITTGKYNWKRDKENSGAKPQQKPLYVMQKQTLFRAQNMSLDEGALNQTSTFRTKNFTK